MCFKNFLFFFFKLRARFVPLFSACSLRVVRQGGGARLLLLPLVPRKGGKSLSSSSAHFSAASGKGSELWLWAAPGRAAPYLPRAPLPRDSGARGGGTRQERRGWILDQARGDVGRVEIYARACVCGHPPWNQERPQIPQRLIVAKSYRKTALRFLP